METNVIELFDNDEAAYLSWVHAHPSGYVVNVDRARTRRQYPMVHIATHKLISGSKGGFTTGDYIKFCSTDLDALDRYSQREYGCPLTRCAVCM